MSGTGGKGLTVKAALNHYTENQTPHTLEIGKRLELVEKGRIKVALGYVKG